MQRSCVRLVVYILNYEVLQGRSLAVCFLCWPCIARGTIKGSSTASRTWSLAKAWPWPNFATLFLYSPLYTKCFIQVSCLPSSFSFLFLKKYFIYLFCEGRRRKGEREGEKHQCVIASGKPPNGVPGQQRRHLPWWGIDPATLLVRRPAFNPLSHTSQGSVPWLCFMLLLHRPLLFPQPSHQAQTLQEHFQESPPSSSKKIPYFLPLVLLLLSLYLAMHLFGYFSSPQVA